MIRNQYRQGDVLLIQEDKLPEGCLEEEVCGTRIVLALGEATGHSHAIDASFARAYQNSGERYLVAQMGAVLKHEEHDHLSIKPGVYRVLKQREYEPTGWRGVLD